MGNGFFPPIHCVLNATDGRGSNFEFFRFERNPSPSFMRGCFSGDPQYLQYGLKVHNFTLMDTSLPFILRLRWTCETIFDMMLRAYVAGLKAYYNRLQEKAQNWEKQGLTSAKKPSLDGWDQALQSAECALAAFREAERLHKDGDLDSADATVDQALLALRNRYKFYSSAHLINHSLLFFFQYKSGANSLCI